MLLAKSVQRGDFTLASGGRSDLYVDCRMTTLDGEGACLVGSCMHALMGERHEPVIGVGGLTMGADPVALAISMFSFHTDPECSINAFSVRKGVKEHGRKRLVEGNFKAGDVVVVVDDVITTGGSTLQAIEKIEAEGGRVAFVMALLDREEGGRANIEARGYDVLSLFTRTELLEGVEES